MLARALTPLARIGSLWRLQSHADLRKSQSYKAAKLKASSGLDTQGSAA